MTTSELARKIDLSPRAIVLTGRIRERLKKSMSGFTPHYPIKDSPPLEYGQDLTVVNQLTEGSAIEADFAEAVNETVLSLAATYGRTSNMVHLQFGRQGTPASATEARILFEAGEAFKRSAGQPTHLAALPTFAPGAYGAVAGRLVPLGLFSETGDPVWLHPAAVGTLLKAAFPVSQKFRTLSPAPVVEAPPEPAFTPVENWYEVMRTNLAKTTKFTGMKLHNTVISSYANMLVVQGKAPDITTANKQAREEYEVIKSKGNSAPLPAPRTTTQTQKASAPVRLTQARV
ncbi:hypothetical protein OPIT5_00175 (plasmid) [Opitutaceae bacterium TAV5]|nr:hypothetical protein OPIT5_00170 [Opitutaceae bacterium TAV5]AHF94984.1 hypothetical protein OPIT5_00175 [Opitutaceae bacterium TAV5]